MMNDERQKGSQKPGARSQKKNGNTATQFLIFPSGFWLLAPDSLLFIHHLIWGM
jgi:hypothetical protein